MNIAIDITNFSINSVYYGESIKNAIIDNGKFMRIFYSNDIMTLNGVYIKFDYDFKKMGGEEIERVLNMIKTVETNILDKINIPNKNKVIKISDYLMNSHTNYIATSNHTNSITNANANANANATATINLSKIHNLNKMLLKISGIWETANDVGVTFKFIEINRQ